MPIYKPAGRQGRDDPWYALFKDHRDIWVRKSTGLTDKKLAEAKLLSFQRTAADPDGATQNQATLRTALNLLIEDRESKALAGTRSTETVSFYRKKSGVLIDVLGADLLCRQLTAVVVDGYIHQRRKDGAGENTISKELGTWSSAMKLAKRARIWTGDMSIFPIAFAPGYKPKKRWLTPEEMLKFQKVMKPASYAVLAFSVATSAEWVSFWRAVPGDIANDYKSCIVRGSKNDNRLRTIPILLPAAQRLLKIAKADADGDGFLLFRYRHNFRRELVAATKAVYPCATCAPSRADCKECKTAHVSPNDLRRTHGKWLRIAGISNADAAPIMGHADSRMMEKVYGQMSAMELAPQLRKQLRKK
jgi:integrase